jgi:hypothetical protein
MPIKKSTLEKKWYYRAVKTFFIILPFLILLLFLLNQKVNVCDISHNNILDFLINNFVYIVIGLVLYYLIVWGIWTVILYLIYGGLDDDMNNKDQKSEPDKQKNEAIIRAVAIVIIIAAILIVVLVKMGYIVMPNDDYNNNANSNINLNINSPPHHYVCPATSAQTATPCHSVKNGVGVEGVIVKDPCRCPSDTTYSGVTDVVTPGGPYKICTCNP